MSEFLIPCSESDHRANAALGYTDVKAFARSAAHGAYHLSHPTQPTRPMILGTAEHACVLEPDKFDRLYVVVEGDRRTKEVKAALEAAEASGKRVLTADEMAQCRGAAQACREHLLLGELLAHPHACFEHSGFWDIDGVPAKCRVDLFAGGIAVDLKFTDDAREFPQKARSYQYAVQCAWYMHGLRQHYDGVRWLFAAIEREEPYGIMVYEPDVEYERMGWSKCARAVENYKDWQASKVAGMRTPDYQSQIVTLSPRAWEVEA